MSHGELSQKSMGVCFNVTNALSDLFTFRSPVDMIHKAWPRFKLKCRAFVPRRAVQHIDSKSATFSHHCYVCARLASWHLISLEVGKGVELIFRHPKLVSGHVQTPGYSVASRSRAEQC